MLATATAQDGRTTHHLARDETRAEAYRPHRPRGRRRQPSNPAPHRASAPALRIRQAHMRMRVVALVTTLVIITGWCGAQGAERAAELDSLDRRWIQDELAAKGFDPGPADGQFGPKTRKAIKAWQEAKGHAITGELTKGQAETLLYRAVRRVFTWSNGDRYEGESINGKRTGRGVFMWGKGRWEGNRYKGEFVDGTLSPDWVCEVLSASTRKLDLQEKCPVYGREGVSHLWLVDPTDRTLEAFELHEGQWLRIASAKDDAPVSIRPFDSITFSLGDLWP